MLFEVLDDFASGLPESWSKANPKIAKSQMNRVRLDAQRLADLADSTRLLCQ
jgi:hypothetical protein